MHTQRQADRRQGPKDRRTGENYYPRYIAQRVGPRERRTAQDPRARTQWV